MVDRASAEQPEAPRRRSKYPPLPAPVDRLPRHVAIIMDGNGRWALRQGFLRLRGHEAGANALRRITRYCAQIGVGELTIYALSTENYLRRPRREVSFLMKLLKEYLIEEREELENGNVQLRAIGRTDEFPVDIQRELEITSRLSSQHTGMILRLALNYGGRREIIDGVKRLLEEHDGVCPSGLDGKDSERAIDEQKFRRYLYDSEMSDPELVIRTAGEARLSNFLLWQASYAEIWVTDVLWPNFGPSDLDAGLEFYATRRRKFGAVDPADSASGSPAAGAAAGEAHVGREA